MVTTMAKKVTLYVPITRADALRSLKADETEAMGEEIETLTLALDGAGLEGKAQEFLKGVKDLMGIYFRDVNMDALAVSERWTRATDRFESAQEKGTARGKGPGTLEEYTAKQAKAAGNRANEKGFIGAVVTRRKLFEACQDAIDSIRQDAMTASRKLTAAERVSIQALLGFSEEAPAKAGVELAQ